MAERSAGQNSASKQDGPSCSSTAATTPDSPAAYWKPQPSKLDKQGLIAALKAGVAIEGAGLGQPQLQLSVRTK